MTTKKTIIMFDWQHPDIRYALQERDFEYTGDEYNFADMPTVGEWFTYHVKMLCPNAQKINDLSLAHYHYEHGDLIFEVR